MNLQALPPEIVLKIYLFLGRKDKAALLRTSSLMLGCCPTKEYIHRIKFKQCMKKIRSMVYNINTCAFSVVGDRTENSLIYRSSSKINRVISECSYREVENYIATTLCFSHTGLRSNDIVVVDAIIIYSVAEKKNGKIIKIMDNPVISSQLYIRRVIKAEDQ